MASPSRLPAARRPAAASSAKARPMSMFDVPSDHLKRLQQIGDSSGSGSEKLFVEGSTTSKQSKRRSLLPTFSRRTPTEEEKEPVGTIREDTSDSEVSTRPGSKHDRKAMPPPPKPTRPTSMRAPGATAPARTTSLHAKTTSRDGSVTSRSTGGATSTPKTDQSIKRTGSTKLPNGPRSTVPASASTQQAIPTRGSSARATTSTTAQKRSSISVSKPPALETSGLQQTQAQPSPPSPTSSAASRPSTRSQAAASLKPSFSTYQQHYSPAKSALPKPPIPSAKSVAKPIPSSSGEAELAITFDVALEQVQLLQLTLLHRSSGPILSEYEASARRDLGKRHSRLRKDYESIRSYEQEQRRLTNLAAIESWCPDEALLAEHLQTVSRVVTAIRAHTDPGSRYSDLSDSFDAWATRAEATLFDDQPAGSFIEALPESWRATHTSLALKLRSIQRDLDTLPPVPPASPSDSQSSLEIILDGSSSLVDDMLKALEVMTKLQKEVLQRGKARIDEQINALISANQSGYEAEKENWVPA